MNPSTPTRLLWPDVAKGVCILLVVLHHVTTKHYAPLVADGLGPVEHLWVGLSSALKPVRMPLFFLVSGFFAAGVVHRDWTDVRARVLRLAYVYVVWLVLLWGVFTLEVTLPTNRTQGWLELILDVLYASTGLWFLYALALYTALATVLRQRPVLVVVVAAAVSLLSSFLPLEETNRVSVLFHFTFFALGAYAPHVVRRVAQAGLSLRALVAAYACLSLLLVPLDPPRSIELVLLSVVGLPAGITAAVELSRIARVAEPLAWLGRRTLPVYVLHMVVIAVVQHSGVVLGEGRTAASFALTVGYPVLVTALVVTVCLVGHTLAVRHGLGFLFALPGAAPTAPERRAERPSRAMLTAPGRGSFTGL
ncbi:acyltransferase family protein [Nocardioides sp.]|uniref:acyltransferase family protein n=1 Tax=Nocardioides sp. TaxID=35761 RepID=UPI00286CEB6E|nr:acyltransferase family protein [Nocardioides sp.]